MAVLLARIHHLARVAGPARQRAVDELFLRRPHIVRALLEASCPRRVAAALAEIMDAFGIEPMSHTRRLLARMALLGEVLGLDAETCETGALGTLMHDIGKLAVPDDILFSPATLAPSELDLIQMHSSFGHAVAFGVRGLRDAATMVLCHHEYYDGTGYHGWARCELPLLARMFSVVDSYDAMIRHDRPFRDGVDHQRAIGELRELAGSKYDPRVVAAVVENEARWIAAGEEWNAVPIIAA